MKRVLAVLVLALMVTGACSDDDDVSTGDESTTTSAPGAASATTATSPTASDPPSPAYEFAVAPDNLFDPAAVALDPVEVGEEITSYLYPGQIVRFVYIELDPMGDPCPTEAAIEVADATGVVIATGSGAEVVIPDDAAPGPATVTVRCERDGEPGEGTLEPVTIASLVDVTVAPTSIPAGASVTVELEGGCTEGWDGVAGITPEEGPFAVFADPVPLAEDGTATLSTPDGLPASIQYATVQCFDGESLALGLARFEVTGG